MLCFQFEAVKHNHIVQRMRRDTRYQVWIISAHLLEENVHTTDKHVDMIDVIYQQVCDTRRTCKRQDISFLSVEAIYYILCSIIMQQRSYFCHTTYYSENIRLRVGFGPQRIRRTIGGLRFAFERGGILIKKNLRRRVLWFYFVAVRYGIVWRLCFKIKRWPLDGLRRQNRNISPTYRWKLFHSSLNIS